MRFEERVAHRLLEKTARYRAVAFRQDQHESIADFALERLDGSTGLAEVAVLTDPELLATSHAVRDGFVPRTHCTNDWLVSVRQDANIRRLKSSIDHLLGNFEAESLEDFGPNCRYEGKAWRALHRSGVESAMRYAGLKRPGILLLAPTFGGHVEHAALSDGLSHVFAREDNLRKLSAGDHGERHLLISVDLYAGTAWNVVVDYEPTKDFICPPSPVTDVTVFAFARSTGVYAAWSWCSETGWSKCFRELDDDLSA